MPVSGASSTQPLYTLIPQHELSVDARSMHDPHRLVTSAGPDDAKRCHLRVFSRSGCVTLSLCLLCSLLTFVVTIHTAGTSTQLDAAPHRPHVSPFSVQSSLSSLLPTLPFASPAIPTSPAAPDGLAGAYTSYYALSTQPPIHASHPPIHNSTLYATPAQHLPTYIATTRIDHTQTRAAYQLIDQAMAGAGRWPGRVDLMVRTTTFSTTILPLMLQSIEQYWPRNIGRCLVVADELYKDRWQMRFTMPEWCELHFEYVLPEMAERGRWAMQWHDFWGDNYTSADYVAVADTDSYFTFKITPDVLFDAQGRVHMSIDKGFQRGMYDKDTLWWLGDINAAAAAVTPNMSHLLQHYPINFMQNLPIVMPTELFSSFRQYVMSKHGHDERNLTHFDAVNRDFLLWHMSDPSQFCILGNYWLYYSPPHLRNRLHIVLTDHSTFEIDRQLLGLPAIAAADEPLEKTWQIFMKATVHVPHNSYYRGHPSVKRKHPEDKVDPPSLYEFTYRQFHTATCQVQKYWRHIDKDLWDRLCGGLTTDDVMLHMDLSMLYCYFESGWYMNMQRRDLSVPHAYQAKWGWMGEIVNVGFERGLDAAVAVVKRYPTHVEWDREQMRLKAVEERHNKTAKIVSPIRK